MLNFCYCSYGQNSPSVRVAANEFAHVPVDGTSRDWVFSAYEDSKYDIISTGYMRDKVDGFNRSLHPSLIKIDKDLNHLWQHSYTWAKDASGATQYLRGFGALYDVLEYKYGGVSYYVAVGYARMPRAGSTGSTTKSKLIIVKTTLDGELVTGFPRVYNNNIGSTTIPDTSLYNIERRARGIIYNDQGDGAFYIAGSEGGVACVYKLDASLSFGSLDQVFTQPSGDANGMLNGLCFQYDNGATPNGKPAPGSDPDPLYVWATGMSWDQGLADSNVIITRVELDFTGIPPLHQTVSETAPSNPVLPTQIWGLGGGGWEQHPSGWYDFSKNQTAWCGSKFYNRTSGDLGQSIKQLADGNIIVAGLANIIYRDSVGNKCMQTRADHLIEWTDGDVFARIIYPDNFPTKQLVGSGGYEVDCKHLGHMSGLDYFVKINQDYDGNLYFTGSTGDTGVVFLNTSVSPNRDLLSNMFVIKTKVDLDILWKKAYRDKEPNQMACCFGAIVCKNNELVLCGDNKKAEDNYSYLRLSKDCAINKDDYDWEATTPTSEDFVTISTLDLLSGTPGTLNITSSKTIKGRLLIEDGCTVNVSNGAVLEFADLDQLTDLAYENGFQYGVEVEPGGKLELFDGSVLTSLDVCDSKWRGVHLQAGGSPDQSNASTIGILEMEDSQISNAVCGVTVEGGGLITCTNTGSYTTNNFLNNRKGVSFLPFSTDNLSRFNFTNFSFISPDDVIDYYGIGLNTHCSMYGVEKVIFNGCTFKNTYTGPFRVGLGLASFDATFQVLRGNNGNSSECYPIGRTPVFENLTCGISSNRTPEVSPTSFIGVGETDFNNCGIGWECDNDGEPLAYKNNFSWTDELGEYPMPLGSTCIGLSTFDTDHIKFHENTFETNDDYPVGFGMVIANGEDFSFTSLVRKNIFTKNIGSNVFSTGILTNGDNLNFELKCNEFIGIGGHDWLNNGPMKNQGSGSENDFGNIFGSTGTNIHSNSGSFDYFYKTTAPTYSGYAGVQTTSEDPEACLELNKCDIYNEGILGLGSFQFEDVALLIQKPEEIIWNNIKVKNYTEAAILTNKLPDGNYKKFLSIIIPILQTHRESKPTPQEVEKLKEIAFTHNEASTDARHFLSFFLEILIIPDYTLQEIKGINTKANTLAVNKEQGIIKFNAYPNPTNGIVNFEWDLKTNQSVSLLITDLNGKVVAEFNNLESKAIHIVDLKSQANGVYIYKILNGTQYFKTGKIVLSR